MINYKKIAYSFLLFLLFSPSVFANISGRVYSDIDGDGAIDASETGVAGVTVTAYDSAGAAQGTGTTIADGSYTFAVTGSAPYRIEFSTIPAPFIVGATGTNSGSTVQFVPTDTESNIDLAVHDPNKYIPDAANSVFAVSVTRAGASHGQVSMANAYSFMALPYSATGDSTAAGDLNVPDSTRAVSFDQTGSTWGGGYQRSSGILYTSSFLKRHSGLGPLVRPTLDGGEQDVPVDGIYKINYSGTLSSSYIGGFTINGVTPAAGTAGVIDLGTVRREAISGAVTTARPNALRNAANSDSFDVDAFDKAGKVGFGGSSVEDVGDGLWLVNLNQKSLIKIDISDPTALPNSGALNGSLISHYPIDFGGLPACNGEFRPWGIKFEDGMGYLGTVCDGSTGSSADAHAYVMRFDPATVASFTTVLDFSLAPANYSRESSQYGLPRTVCGLGTQDAWNRWGNSWADMGLGPGENDATYGDEISCPQPILSDITFDTNGDMILGMMDRTTLQLDRANYAADTAIGTNRYYSVDGGGDTLHACLVGANYIIEGAAGCIIDSDTKSGPDTPASRFSLADGPGNQGEFYFQDYSTQYDSGDSARHVEVTSGTVAVLPGTGEVLVTVYDAIEGDFNQGFHWYRTQTTTSGTPGTISDQYQISQEGSGDVNTKGMALGDIEFILPPAPLEIGNRIWNDDDKDGEQDANETIISGVTVTLVCGAQSATTTTDGNGYYLFKDGIGDIATWTNGEIPRDTDCQILVSETDAALSGKLLTVEDQASGNDTVDSDATSVGGNAVVNFRTGQAGQNNHSYDIGFITLFDYGDAVDPNHPTLDANSGAKHQLGSNVYLGSCVDAEDDGQPSADATGDDSAVGSTVFGTCASTTDEDGVTIPSLSPNASADFTIEANAACLLNAWIDWDGNGDWSDAGEQIATDVALTAGSNTLAVSVPASIASNPMHARFRCSTAGGDGFTGTAADGEVEDYVITVQQPQADLMLVKTASATEVLAGDTLTYTLTLRNTGGDNSTGITITDQLPAGVTYASDTPSQGSYNSGTGIWTVGALASGATATLAITVTIN